MEGDEELTLRGNDCGTHHLTNTARIQAGKRAPPFGQDDWAAICQALYQCGAWRDMHPTLLEVAKCKGIKKRLENELPVHRNWQRVERKSDDSLPTSMSRSSKSQRNEVRGQLLAVWDRDPQHAEQFCGERHLEEHVSLRNLWRQKLPETGGLCLNDSRLSISCRLNVNGCACSGFVSSPPMNHDSHVPLACRTRILKQNQEGYFFNVQAEDRQPQGHLRSSRKTQKMRGSFRVLPRRVLKGTYSALQSFCRSKKPEPTPISMKQPRTGRTTASTKWTR